MNMPLVQKHYHDQFAAREERLPGYNLPWMRRCRAMALDRFLAIGFPTHRLEEWKYTNPSIVTEVPFALGEHTCIGLDPEDLNSYLLDRQQRAHMVFVNGYYSPALSDSRNLPTGVRMGSLAALLTDDPVEAMTAFGNESLCDEQGFSELNRALWQDGVFLHLESEVSLDQPVQLLFLSTETFNPLLIQPRNLLIAESGCRARVVETHLSLGAPAHCTNHWTMLLLEQGAALDYLLLIDQGSAAHSIGTIHAILAADSTLDLGLFAFGNRLTRQEIVVSLAEKGAQCRLKGLFAATGRQHVDFHLNIRHNASATTSHQEFRGVVDDHAHGVFDGRVLASPGMEGIVSSQTTRNLVLSSHAEIDAKPQLEIHTNAVQCTHGATVGSLDDEAIFYLRSRGLDEETARSLLVTAFVGELLEQIEPTSLRAWMIRRFNVWRNMS